jgi:hypothetical protein
MTELDWQQVGAKEVMKDRQVLPDRLIDTHPIEHTSLLPQPARWLASLSGPLAPACECARVGSR